MSSSQGSPRDLAIALYIDGQRMLDLIARSEGGLTFIERLTTRTETSSGSTIEAAAAIGLPEMLSFLKLKGQVGGSSDKATTHTDERASDRYHTEGSLLLRLRDALSDEGLLVDLASAEPHSGDFLELRGVLRPNPLADSVKRFVRVIDLMRVMAKWSDPDAGGEEDGDPPRVQGQSKAARERAIKEAKARQAEVRRAAEAEVQRNIGMMETMSDIFSGLLADIEEGEASLFVLEPEEGSAWTGVMRLFPGMARDPSFRELSGVEVRVLAKVVSVEARPDASLSLLDGTGLGQFREEVLNPLLGAMGQLGEAGLRETDVTVNVPAPAVRVVPIGIYI